MAESKKKEEAVQAEPFNEKKYWAERVPFRAFKDNGKYKDDIFVGWNGRPYLIRRGVEVMIPRAVREIIYESMEQDEKTASLIERESSRFEEESSKYR